ncbi:uncharacterized protein DUF5020 [Breznakibacter xylanolyticus]|uniref:Uncharacterized protein DUF5020 n=1 Tax=Breznakibacter xylanolyticus TaxID=990 RepID=A0A2W7NEN8_9BACT|nr:DUF5020 family protein [Breznakibacter xylanolyticus]PZX18658.1 uncharacterized protein DUF5020 [Breznakibacter xylanolyticus]
MKQLFRILLLALLPAAALAQNVQMHYDLGKDRRYVTTTVEMFKPDAWGSTFFFVDMDYNGADVNGVSQSYWEIARGLKFWKSPFEMHVEYNGGMGQWQPGGAFQINDAWLFGGNYTWNNADFTRIFTLQAMYKTIRDKHDASFQLTGVWTLHLMNRKVTFSGFADFWREDNTFGTETTRYVFLSEPQLWYNATEHLSLGTEVEISSNFAGNKGMMVNPTLAAKWNF